MGRFIGGRFGSIVPVAPDTSAPSAVYSIHDQYYTRQDGGWLTPTGLTATGGVISDYVSGTDIYRAHIFTSSGTFNVTAPGTHGDTVEYLVVAGGGGGGGSNGISASAGAGGLRTNVPGVVDASNAPLTISTPFPVSTTGGNGSGGYTVTVGAGGYGGPKTSDGEYKGGQGGDSYFGPPVAPNGITASGGGRGRTNHPYPVTEPAYPGGSGGGGVGNDPATGVGQGNAGGYSPPEGYPGGVGGTSTNYGSGGGGGAGGAGGNGAAGQGGAGGNGGIGVQVAISGPPTFTGAGALNPGSGQYQWFAGGGGGGGYAGAPQGGVGGGGNAGTPSSTVGKRGQFATGGGGGASDAPQPNHGGSGGSGIVIIRYLIGTAQTGTAKATGGAVSFYNGKTIHTFTGAGTFTTPATFQENCEYVVIAGGGSGGGVFGGGGAGGYRQGTTPIGPNASMPVVVGGGGANAKVPSGYGYNGRPGNNSNWGPIIAGGGGFGAATHNTAGGPGGSGGGGSDWAAGGTSGGTGNIPNTSPPQGNPGGSAAGVDAGGGGGGGAGGAGQDGTSAKGGNGGLGVQLPATFRNPVVAPNTTAGGGLGAPGPGSGGSGLFWVCGGGGAGSYTGTYPNAGPGSGGTGPTYNPTPYAGAGEGGINPDGPGTDAVQFTGSGGGGATRHNGSVVQGAGGSGIVMVAYPT